MLRINDRGDKIQKHTRLYIDLSSGRACHKLTLWPF